MPKLCIKKPAIVWLVRLGLTLLLSHSLYGQPLSVTLSVGSGSKIQAHLHFRNVSVKSAHLYRPFVCGDGVLRDNLFYVSVGKQKMRYTGVLAKRAGPKPDDFVTLQPYKTLSCDCELNDAYLWLPGSRVYVIYYEVEMPFADRAGSYTLRSNQVRVRISAPSPSIRRP